MKFKKIIIIFLFILFPFGCFASLADKPEISSVVQKQENNFLTTGRAEGKNNILIFLDGNFIGTAEAFGCEMNVCNFSFSFLNTISDGTHFFQAKMADAINYRLSEFSNKFEFEVNKSVAVPVLAAPILISPTSRNSIGVSRPKIAGLTLAETEVEIFIDGKYDGTVKPENKGSGLLNFQYKPNVSLEVGWHFSYAVAKNKSGLRSTASNRLDFEIEEKLPAPVLKDPIYKEDKTWVVGFTKNDFLVKIFIDDKEVGLAKVNNDNSGTANFIYNFPNNISRGGHLVYAIAIDLRGKESERSNYVYYFSGEIENQKYDVTKSSAAKPVVLAVDFEDENIMSSGDAQSAESDAVSAVSGASGLISEKQDRLSKIHWNMAVFFVFLILFLFWCYWVNRELVKKRRKKNKENCSQEKLL